MSEFWFWFWRPFAEFLGTVALIFGVVALYALFIFAYEAWRSYKNRKRLCK